MLPDLISIYQAFSKGRNLLLPRVDGEKYQGKTIYVCYDGGTPIAYVILSEHKELYVNNYRNTLLTVNEMAYVSPKGLREIFSFLRMFEGEFDEIELLDGGLYSEVDLLLRHYVHTKYTSIADLSAKLLNTEAMLLANTYPQKEGAFTVKITDELPTVAGVYRVSYGGGDCQVKRLDDTAQSDILLPSNVFTRLIYGNDPIDERNVRYFDGVEIYGNTEDLFRAFPKRPCGVFEHF